MSGNDEQPTPQVPPNPEKPLFFNQTPSFPPGQEEAGGAPSAQREAEAVTTAVLQKACEDIAKLLYPRQLDARIPIGATRQSATVYIQQTVESFLLPAVNLAEWGWTIIANAGGGDWTKESEDWKEAAGKYRDTFYNQFGKLLSEKANEKQCALLITPKPATAPVRQEEGAWRDALRELYTSSALLRLRVKERGQNVLRFSEWEKHSAAMTLAEAALANSAHNASLRDKTEQEKTQAWADHEGLLQCRALLNVQEGDNLYDAIKRLAAEKEASERNTHVLQKALAGLIESWRRRMLICREAARGQYLKGQADTFEDCCYELEKLLSEHAPKSSLGSELPEADITFHETRYQRSSTSDGSGLPKAEEE